MVCDQKHHRSETVQILYYISKKLRDGENKVPRGRCCRMPPNEILLLQLLCSPPVRTAAARHEGRSSWLNADAVISGIYGQ